LLLAQSKLPSSSPLLEALPLRACNARVERMRITEVTVEVSNPRDQTHWQQLDLIADTGVIFSVIPRSTLDQLGISPYAE
jgi:hypothetical protein